MASRKFSPAVRMEQKGKKLNVTPAGKKVAKRGFPAKRAASASLFKTAGGPRAGGDRGKLKNKINRIGASNRANMKKGGGFGGGG